MNREQVARELLKLAKDLTAIETIYGPFWYRAPNGVITIYARYQIGGYRYPREIPHYTKVVLKHAMRVAQQVSSMTGFKAISEKELVGPSHKKGFFHCVGSVDVPLNDDVIAALDELGVKETEL